MDKGGKKTGGGGCKTWLGLESYVLNWDVWPWLPSGRTEEVSRRVKSWTSHPENIMSHDLCNHHGMTERIAVKTHLGFLVQTMCCLGWLTDGLRSREVQLYKLNFNFNFSFWPDPNSQSSMLFSLSNGLTCCIYSFLLTALLSYQPSAFPKYPWVRLTESRSDLAVDNLHTLSVVLSKTTKKLS